MNLLLVHQSFPGQFKYLVKELEKDPIFKTVVLTINCSEKYDSVRVIKYPLNRVTASDIHPWVAETETKIIRADAALRAAIRLNSEGFKPDLIIAHPGWGESLFLKEVWPDAKLMIYCEYYYSTHGRDIGFDPEFYNDDLGDACRIRLKNVNNLLHFEVADYGVSPTYWQRDTFPEPFRSKIRVIHDGINTNTLKPEESVWLKLGDQRLTRHDEIITFVNRNLEPYRGYHSFMRSLPKILANRPNAKVLIVGGDGVSYGAKSDDGRSWKDIFLDEVKDRLDLSRVHFVGSISYQHYIALLQLSTVHVYLTYPFVLSWSLLEAMSCGCAIVASDTDPVREVLKDRKTGILVDFFKPEQLADAVLELLDSSHLRGILGSNARDFVVQNYDQNSICLPKMMNWIKEIGTEVKNL